MSRPIHLNRSDLARFFDLDRDNAPPARAMLADIGHLVDTVMLSMLEDGGEGDVAISRTLQFIGRLAAFGCAVDEAFAEAAEPAKCECCYTAKERGQ